VRIQAVVQVDNPADVGPTQWRHNHQLADRVELNVTVGDLLMTFSEPAATWLQGMLSAVMIRDEGTRHSVSSAIRVASDGRDAGPPVRIQVHVSVYRPGEVGRPRWEHHGRDLVLAIGDLFLVFTRSAARQLLESLTDGLASEFETSQLRHSGG
jgi:hypothetical protein